MNYARVREKVEQQLWEIYPIDRSTFVARALVFMAINQSGIYLYGLEHVRQVVEGSVALLVPYAFLLLVSSWCLLLNFIRRCRDLKFSFVLTTGLIVISLIPWCDLAVTLFLALKPGKPAPPQTPESSTHTVV